MLNVLWFGTPAWTWLVFLAIVVVLLAFDLGVLNKKDHVIGVKESLKLSALYFALAAMVARFHYLKYSLAAVLVFIGSKIFLGDFVFGGKVPAGLSLAVTG